MPAPRSIDLNCDLGEGTGHDAELMRWITSANIACGAHAGDAATMRATVKLAQLHGVAIGAHPGFADRANFGRVALKKTPAEIRQLVREQIEALGAFGPVRHVKPHGALYNLAAKDAAVAEAIAQAVAEVDRSLLVFGLAGSESIRAAEACGLRTVSEVFADRTYQADGSLTPRDRANALIETTEVAVAQALRMITEGKVRAADGRDVRIIAGTICLHGDGAHAVEFARALHEAIRQAGVTLAPAARAE